MACGETGWQENDTEFSTVTGESAARAPAVVPALTILAHADPGRIGERLSLPALPAGFEVRLSRLEPVFSAPGGDPRPLACRRLSRRPIRLAGGDEPGAVALDASATRTPVAADGEPVSGRRVFSAAEIARGVVLLLGGRVALLLHRMAHRPSEAASREELPDFGLVGESDAVVRLRREIRRLAPLDVSVLLQGETGTGKELVARALHDAGPRRERPFVAVNMGALNPSLAAAALFGAVRGAYTGAERKKDGFFQSARDGTLFLDEIGETPPEVQVMLLRALESCEVRPVGSTTAQKTDVRVIAATDARLEEAIAAGGFRAPLYHRLAGYAVHLPTLRERRDDVGRLLYFFLAEELAKPWESAPGDDRERPWPPAEIVARLARYDWPGNVRELRNVARQLAIAGREAPNEALRRQMDELLRDLRGPVSAAPASPPPAVPPAAPLTYRQPHEVGEEELLEALAANGWRIQPTAAHLGVSRTSLYAMIDRSAKIRRASELSPEELAACKERHGGDLRAMAAELRVSPHGLRQRLRELATSS